MGEGCLGIIVSNKVDLDAMFVCLGLELFAQGNEPVLDTGVFTAVGRMRGVEASQVFIVSMDSREPIGVGSLGIAKRGRHAGLEPGRVSAEQEKEGKDEAIHLESTTLLVGMFESRDPAGRLSSPTVDKRRAFVFTHPGTNSLKKKKKKKKKKSRETNLC